MSNLFFRVTATELLRRGSCGVLNRKFSRTEPGKPLNGWAAGCALHSAGPKAGLLTDLLELGGLYSDLEAGFSQKKLDVLTTQMLSRDFLAQIQPEEVLIYAS